ncbi:MAG: translocation/assembly module TamB, partial [Dysgonamonadaceae bacterium]|nr:translocation/assembly module TamB [Dysgonamonadaceae bacterium]
LAENLFDVNHISIQNLQAGIYLQFVDLENLKADIAYLSFTEKSGFRLDDLHFSLQSGQKVISLNDFAVRLPHSELKIDDARLDYTGLEIKDMFAKAGYSLRMFSGKINSTDWVYFYPLLKEYPEELSFSGKLEGRFPELNIPFLELNYGKNLALAANAKISDLYHWEKSAFVVQINNCLIDKIKSPVVLNETNLTGKINGSLPGLHFNLHGKSGQGDLKLQGKGGYIPASGNIDFDLKITASNLNMKQLLSDSTYGTVSFQAATQGKITGKGKINANLETGISQLDYKDYSYRNVSVKANYMDENIEIDINSEDENLPLTLHGTVNLNEKNQEAGLHANLHGVRLDILNWLPEYPGAELSGLVDVRVKSFNPETMTASAMIDSLRFSTQNGVFNDFPVTINYTAGSNKQKQLNIRSKVLNVRGKGNFTYDGINRSLQQAFPTLFSEKISKKRKLQLPEENFNFFIAVRQANTVSHLLGMGTEIPDSAMFMGKYNSGDSLVSFDATAFCLFSAEDTTKLHLNLSNSRNKLAVQLDVNNRSDQYDLTGYTSAEIEFIRKAKNTFPDMHIELNPGSISLNETAFHIYPAQIDIRDKHYEINNFALRHSSSEYLKINGIVSENRSDSLLVDINRFEIKTILDALKYNIPLSGSVSGDISLSQLTNEPRVVTRDFSVDNILFNNDSIGNLKLISGWSSARQGLFLRATLSNPHTQESVVSGFVLPGKDSLALTGDIHGIQLNWFDDYTAGSVYGLDGEFSAKIRIDGKVSAPALTGTAYLKNAKAGVTQLNTVYQVSDSIELQPDKIVFKDFTIYDENRKTGKINGTIGYKNFSNMNPKLTLDFNNFLVLNNAHQIDSLFFGRLNINGRLNIGLQNKNWLIQGDLTHGKSNFVMANIPESVEAQRYGWITFVNNEEEKSAGIRKNPKPEESSGFSLPMKLKLTFSINPGLNAGVILNLETGNIAQAQGNGNIGLSYDLNNMNMSLQGTYTVENGDCSLALKNITKKTFNIQNGSKLVFKGDPLNSTFDLTAVYSLKASLASLDPSFAEITSAGKIPVDCLLKVSGDMKNPQLQYQVVLPSESTEIQRKLDGLLYTDDIKIKEIAYLLALGSFMPVSSDTQTTGGSDIWTSIASSSVTSQLNSLLAGVLSDNWTIGTDLYSSDGSMSKMDMDVNISTKLFDDRLVVNSTLGYHNNVNPGGQTDNFTGDFDLEYKLSPGGNVLLRFFNITNNRYYEKAKTTQGVGIVYKRQGKTFRQLFRSFGSKKQ